MLRESESYGLVYGVASAIIFSVMAIAAQQISSSVSASQISAFRGFFTVIALFPFALPHLKKIFEFKITKYVWIRSIAGGIAVAIYFYNLKYTSAANAKSLANTSPFFVAIISWFLYRERLSKFEFLGLVTLIAGAWLLAFSMNKAQSSEQWIIGSIGSLFTAIAYLSLKKASSSFPTSVIVFCFGIAVVIASSILPGKWNYPVGSDWIWLFITGFTGLFGQILLTYSYFNLKNSIASALTLLQSLCLITYDYLWTGKLSCDLGLLGNVLILLGMILIVIFRPVLKQDT